MNEITDEIINLILTMISTYGEYGDKLNFTKSDIDNIMKKYNFLNNIQCNELGLIVLYKNKYITPEIFADKMDVKYIDKNFWLVVDGFDDILSKEYESEIKILDWDDDWWTNSDWYENDISYHWDDYTEDTLKEIIKYCIDNGIEVDDELMDESNTILKNGDIYFNDEKLVDMIDNDEFDELKTILNGAICEAQNSADQSETYTKVKDAFEYGIGPFEKKMVDYTSKYTKETKNVEKLYVRLDFSMNDVEKHLKYHYAKYDFVDESFGDLFQVLRDMEFFDFKVPYYDNISGDIDNDLLNEFTREQLKW